MADLLRLNIDGDWTINEFAQTFEAIQQLYDFQVYCRWLQHMDHRQSPRKRLYRMMEMMDLHPMEAEFLLRFPSATWRESDATLESISATTKEIREADFPTHLAGPARVKRINYSSPGVTDIAGVGEIIGHIKDLILRVLEMCLNREHQKEVARKLKLENDKSEIQMAQVRLEAIDQFIDVARKAGFTKTQVRSALQSVDGKVELLVSLVQQGKITSIELVDEESEG